nr:TonB-dependent receptor [Blastocatellia bacterium]
EYDRLGFGRIEILTRPGSDQWRGSAFLNFNDARLNSRNPFALNRAPSQTRTYGGNVSGPIQKGRSSFFLDISNRDIDSNSVINAIILDPNLNEVPFQQEIQVPTRRFSVSPRFDYAINQNNTLIVRYSYSRNSSENQGLGGGLALPSRAFESSQTSHEIRLTETMIINAKTINETRFQYEFNDRGQIGDNTIPGISVGSAFQGGGATIGFGFNRSHGWELQNYTTTSLGATSQHAIKFGFLVRGVRITDRSENNFGGNFTFLNLDSYRDTILGNNIPLQFSITTGTPELSVSRTDYGVFFTDDWRVNPGLTLSFGLRYENQTNINDSLNFAPRFSVAWAPGAGGARAPKTVIRGGFGIFYDRFSENLTLQALRFNGENQLNLIVNQNDPDPVRRAAAIALLSQPVFTVDGVTNVPTAAQILAALPQSNTIRSVSSDLSSPYTSQIAIGVERQLPARSNMSVFYIGARTNSVLRARNINAPICPEQVNCLNSPRPFPEAGNIYEYESTGRSTQNQMIVNFRSNLHQRVNLFGNYRLGFANNDTDGAGSFPAYSYDLADEYGRASFDIRHFFTIGGNVTLPWRISASPFININSGRPFNITRGVDSNADSLFTERPTFGELGARCAEFGLSFSYCDVAGYDPDAIIPRNFGRGPMSFTANLRLNRTFGFGTSPEPRGGATTGQTGAPPTGGIPVGRGGRGGGGGMRGGGGFGGGGRSPYNLTVGLNIINVFNTVNFNPPVGNLSSSRFGQYTSTGGGWGFGGGGGGSANRRVELSARFSW